METKQLEKINWNLDDIFKLEEFDNYLAETKKKTEEIDKYIALLSPEMNEVDFVRVMDYEEEMGERFSKMAHRAGLMEEVNQKDQTAKLMKSKVTDLALEYSKKARAISFWLKGKEVEGLKTLDDDNARRLFKVIPELEYSLSYSRKAAKHTLEKREEEIIDNKDAFGSQVLTDLRDLIATEFTYNLEVEGEKPRLIKTQAELMALSHSPIRKERMAAYKTLLTKHKDNIDKFFAIYQGVVKDWDYEAKLRGYSSPIGMRNFANHIPDEAIETMMKVTRENAPVFQRYFKLKAKELRLRKLRREDIYAPLESSRKKYSFEEAWKMVESTFDEFSIDFGNKARKIIEDQHVDAYPDENKRNGAFCATVSPKITPYLLLNHTGEERDVATLAHELGHGIHSLYAANLRAGVQHANLPLAETASTMGEMILFEKMYKSEKDSKKAKAMLAEKISDSYASILRQNYFVFFEMKAHEEMSKGTTAERLGKLWYETLEEQFGESVQVDPLFEYEWSYIPHIVHTPFYCYAYNFGELLSLALFAKYKDEGGKFVPKFEKVLAVGGSRNPDEVLREIGVDMSDSDFWQGSFKIIQKWVDDLESL